MGLLDLWRKRNQPEEPEDVEGLKEEWQKIVYSRKDVNLHDPVERREYVQNCLMQMGEGSREIDNLQFEYRTVTAYLHDMEELDELPEEERRRINACAKRIQESETQKAHFMQRKSRMSDAEFERMDRLYGEAPKAVQSLQDAEEHRRRIKGDLKRLDSERRAYDYRKEDVTQSKISFRKLTVFVAGALVVMLLVLMGLQVYLKLDVTYALMAAVLIAAIAIVWLQVRTSDAERELKIIGATITKLVSLQNTVKIRYVNNHNLIEYLCLKFGVNSSDELQKQIEKYEVEKQEREHFKSAERQLDGTQQDLLTLLRKSRIKAPEIWLHQIPALLDHNEEVEIRHDLIVRRQSLRKRMDYNRETVIGNAKAEIEDLAKSYPRYAQEILDQVSRYTLENGIED